LNIIHEFGLTSCFQVSKEYFESIGRHGTVSFSFKVKRWGVEVFAFTNEQCYRLPSPLLNVVICYAGLLEKIILKLFLSLAERKVTCIVTCLLSRFTWCYFFYFFNKF